ncbi:MAG TPA: folylpolyglutamate synthase/dihydrofolate synthase family protein [Pyrinomonadaceae bacterium]|nr:folylpolyglutamate synthase/dihydrofolate synthase family protein [Pyrinomonadaceae bacterium]
MNFDEALRYLLSLGHETLAMKLGLRNTELLLESLGHPHSSYQSVQIAGTNGKGSTAVMLDSICRAGGIRTGLYTSPHLISITERIKIDGIEISTAEFAELATEVRRAADSLLTEHKIEALPTFFEHVTAIALMAFKKAGVQLAILETGLGGRLDATTVAGATTVAITPVAMDHEEYLGSTLSEIASEKAAIIRPGVNAIIGNQIPAALEVILNRSAEVGVVPEIGVPGAEVESATNDGRYTVSFTTTSEEYQHLTIGLRGRHQIENASLAIRIAESLRRKGMTISKTAMLEGIEGATYSGRLELINGAPPLLLDGAHNPAGAGALRQYLDGHVDGPVTLVFGAMKDKKLDEIAQRLFPIASRLIITAPQNPRAAEPDYLRKMAMDHLSHTNIYVAIPAGAALRKAKELTPHEGVICVTGSLYLVGEVKAGLDEHA